MNDILALNLRNRIANQNPSPTPDHHYRMLVLMSLQGRMPTRTNLEIPELNRKIALPLQHYLPSDVAEHIPVFLVGQNVHALPPKITCCLDDHACTSTSEFTSEAEGQWLTAYGFNDVSLDH